MQGGCGWAVHRRCVLGTDVHGLVFHTLCNELVLGFGFCRAWRVCSTSRWARGTGVVRSAWVWGNRGIIAASASRSVFYCFALGLLKNHVCSVSRVTALWFSLSPLCRELTPGGTAGHAERVTTAATRREVPPGSGLVCRSPSGLWFWQAVKYKFGLVKKRVVCCLFRSNPKAAQARVGAQALAVFLSSNSTQPSFSFRPGYRSTGERSSSDGRTECAGGRSAPWRVEHSV